MRPQSDSGIVLAAGPEGGVERDGSRADCDYSAKTARIKKAAVWYDCSDDWFSLLISVFGRLRA